MPWIDLVVLTAGNIFRTFEHKMLKEMGKSGTSGYFVFRSVIMGNRNLLLLPAAVMVMASPTFAVTMVSGTLKAINSTSIVVTLQDGTDQTIPLGKDTMFMKGNDMIGADQVKAGMKVMVALGKDNKTAAHVMVK